jgi:uncharacterized repeat protein (TIGR01451 family)
MRKLMKLLAMTTMLSVAAPCWSQQAVIDVGTASGNAGSTVSLPIDLSTDQAIVALQLDLTFAASVVTPTGATIGGSASNHLIASASAGGGYRIVIYSPTNAALASGRLANVSISIAGGAPMQTVPIGIQAVVLSNASAISIPTTLLDPGSIKVASTGSPALTLSNTQISGANPATSAGQVLGYSIIVTNTGNVSQTGINVTDTLPGGGAGVLVGPIESLNTNGVLEVAETWGYTISYTVTQANIDAGTALVNTAQVITTQVPGPTQSAATTQITQSSALTIVTTQTSGPNPATAASQQLGYSIVIANTGNVSQTSVSVTDTLPNGNFGVLAGPFQSMTNNAILEVGETWTYTTSYSVTQANMDAGAALVNTARVTTAQVPSSTQSAATTPITQSPALTISKTQTSGPNPATLAGQVLGYTIVVTNAGNISHTGVSASDTLPNGNVGVLPTPIQSITTNSIVEVGETWTYTIAYTVTQADIDTGAALVNTARVTTTQVPGPTENTATTQIATPLVFANGFEVSATTQLKFAPGLSSLLVELSPGNDAGSGTLLLGLTAEGDQAFRLELREGSGGLAVRAVTTAGAGLWGSQWFAVQHGDVLRLSWWSARPPSAGNGGLRLWANDRKLIDVIGTGNTGAAVTELRGLDPDGAAGDPLAGGQLRTLRVLEMAQ